MDEQDRLKYSMMEGDWRPADKKANFSVYVKPMCTVTQRKT